MATDIERLVLQLSADVTRLEKQLARGQKSADKSADAIERRFKRMNKNVAQSAVDLNNDFRRALATFGVGLVVRETTQLTDAWTNVGNKVALAGVAAEDMRDTQNEIVRIALDTRTEVEATADLYSRMLRISGDLEASQTDVAKATELVGKALAGAGSSERNSAITQLGQGLGSVRLQGDELKAILENSRPLAEAIADEFGVAVGELKDLGKNGELESKRVFRAILAAAPEIEAAYARTTATVDDAFTNLRTRLVQYVGTNQTAIAVTNSLADAINFVANNLEAFTDAAIIAAAAIGGNLAGVAIVRTVTALRAMIATMAVAQGALTAGAVAAGLATRAMAGLSAVIATLGGPVAVALAAIAAGFAYLATQTTTINADQDEYQRLTKQTTGVIDGYRDAILGAARAHGTEGTKLRELAKARRDAAQAAVDQARTETRAAEIRAQGLLKESQDLAAAAEKAAGPLGALKLDAGELFKVLASTVPGTKENKQIEELKKAAEVLVARRQAAADLEKQLADLDALQKSIDKGGGGGGGGGGGDSKGPTVAELRQQAALSLARLQNDIELVDVLEDTLELQKRISEYQEAGLSYAEAGARADAEVAAERAAIVAQREKNLKLIELENQAEIARATNQTRAAEALEDELEIRRQIEQLLSEGVGAEEARKRAEAYVDVLRRAREEARQLDLLMRDLENRRDIASASLDKREADRLDRMIEAARRMRELQDQGFSQEAAQAIAGAEVDQQHMAELRGAYRQVFRDSVRAAFEGDLKEYLSDYFAERFYNAIYKATDILADAVFSMIHKSSEGLFGMGDGLEAANAAAATSATALAAANANAAASMAALTGVSVSTAVALGGVIAAANAAAAALLAVHAAGGSSGGDSQTHDVIGSIFRFAATNYAGGRAGGGRVRVGSSYTVGENGIERFIPDQPGTIVNGKGSGGGLTIVDQRTINFQGTQQELKELQSILQRDFQTRRSQILGVVRDASSRGQL